MYKKIPNINVYDISEEEYHELCKQPAAEMVIEAVTHYNQLVSELEYLTDKDGNILLTKESEEEETKAFLDDILDIIQQGE